MTVTFGIDLWTVGQVVDWEGHRWRVVSMSTRVWLLGRFHTPLYRYVLDALPEDA
jgi:hypothetical protein